MQMHHHHNHLGKNIHSSSRMSITPKRHIFLKGECDSGLVLSTDAKPRLKWTPDLHEHFIEAVNQLGGPAKATPKSVMKLMGIQGITLYHIKSHLQKYRLSTNLYRQTNSGGTNKVVKKFKRMIGPAGDANGETNGTDMRNSSVCPQRLKNKNLQISEAIQMQIEVQRRLHEQLEVQRHLQLHIEAQGKYLQAVLEKAQETLGKQNLGKVGLEAAKVQLPELVSKASTHCLNFEFPSIKDVPMQTNQQTDCSNDSCLTCCEGQQSEKVMTGLTLLESKNVDSDLSMSVGGLKSSEWNTSRSYYEERFMDGYKEVILMDRNTYKKTDSVKPENIERPKKFQFPYFGQKLDLNANDGNNAASSHKQFDLNGVSW